VTCPLGLALTELLRVEKQELTCRARRVLNVDGRKDLASSSPPRRGRSGPRVGLSRRAGSPSWLRPLLWEPSKPVPPEFVRVGTGRHAATGQADDVLALLAPGQGAQTPGFLGPWLDLDGAAARLRWLSAVCGVDLVRLGTEGSAEEIRDTAVTQPLLVAAGLLAAERLPLEEIAVTAGHSVGELTAAAIAGALTPEAAVALAGVRGREMAAACAQACTGMTALLGGDPQEVLARLDELDLTAANRNGAGQIVAAGPLEGLAALRENPPTRTRVVPLQVAGAFHTAAMEPAEVALAELADGVPVRDPQRLLLSNADGTAVATGPELIKRLVTQVTRPVRWDLCSSTLADLKVTALLELPPAGTLTGLAKRDLRGVELLALRTPDDLPAARDLLARHAIPAHAEQAPVWRVVVAPAAGTFQPAEAEPGDTLAPGSPLGQVQTRRGNHELTAAYDGVLVEWLAVAGDPVAPGQALVRLHPLSGAATGGSA